MSINDCSIACQGCRCCGCSQDWPRLHCGWSQGCISLLWLKGYKLVARGLTTHTGNSKAIPAYSRAYQRETLIKRDTADIQKWPSLNTVRHEMAVLKSRNGMHGTDFSGSHSSDCWSYTHMRVHTPEHQAPHKKNHSQTENVRLLTNTTQRTAAPPPGIAQGRTLCVGCTGVVVKQHKAAVGVRNSPPTLASYTCLRNKKGSTPRYTGAG